LSTKAVRDRLGGLHSADCLLRSVDFTAIELLQRTGRWDEQGRRHDHRRDRRPFVHTADTTAIAVREAGISTVGLLATASTMEHDFYVGRLRDLHGLEVLVPGLDDRRLAHEVIYDELCVGVVRDESRSAYQPIMRDLARRGAQAILLGCTEIDLLIGVGDAPLPVFDTTRLHAEKAVEMALESSPVT
jgi:amino-acid racemase